MKILFQGDSITDADRVRDKEWELGRGYAAMAAAMLELDRPDITCYNRGISGNRVTDLYARIKNDILHLAPDVLSILIGVNDVWHDFAEIPNGVSAEKYGRIYRMLLTEVRAALPEVKLMILEPFVVYGSATEAQYADFRREVEARAAIAREIAAEYGAVFVPLQARLDAAVAKDHSERYTRDGVHPCRAGRALLARAWLDAFAKTGW